ncbi:MAG TPA: phenylalanine--tRNA ligase subunit beta, partial [Candidatus Syntrophosphaera sp.]|nr:phenylalanine--tRNA ligase subunit beta [Candidatus Syntrophosphaera sp.]
MRISRNWLSKYVDLPAEDVALISALTFSGIEVEAFELIPALPETVVTARILSSEKIPETDHLQLCQVDYGAPEPAQVVCGAPNCRAGLVSVLALPGTQLFQLLVKKARLKGVDSAGMLCSEKELGLSDNHAGIVELESQTPLGVPASQLYELPDTLLDLEITPNRPDLLGYLGVARDLSASLKTPLRCPEVKTVSGSDTGKLDLDLVLHDAERCPRYTARLISGVKVQDSPQWLKTALLKSGLRPINNIVDITNYVMLETGHPLHAFDYDRLQALKTDDTHPAIIVRRARPQEQFLALDGEEYELDPEDLVIADGKDASALAGVIGGKNTAISDTTSNIVLEAAAFASQGIRASSYKHKISTDSSYRFERQLSPALPISSSDRATEMILALAGGEVCNALYDAYPEPVQPWYLGLRPHRFSALIGFELSGEEIKGYLSALECEFVQYGNWLEGKLPDLSQVYCHHAEEEKAGKTEFTEIDCDHTLYFRIPSYRVDLTREADLIEEVARLAGYERIPTKTGVSSIMD